MNALTKVGSLFIASYSGIRKEVWWLSVIMLINRSGSMVFPFMSIYLTHHLHFTAIQAGWVLSSFGVGSMIGALVGGWLADRYGNFIIQFVSLVLGGTGWLLLSLVTDFYTLMVFILIQSSISEAMRPANTSAVTLFARGDAMTRSFSLNRMAMNLGYSVGPTIGGIFATISFVWLFIADGISCILAGLIFLWLFRKHFNFSPSSKAQKSRPPASNIRSDGGVSMDPMKDWRFLCFIVGVILFAVVFFQLLFTLPLYYKDVYKISEAQIGLLLATNGLIVFFSEMIFVHVVGSRIAKEKLIILGILATGLSFFMLNFLHGVIWLFVGMAVLSFGEILAMPFMQTYVANQASDANLGRYMALYSFAYSTALILAPFIGVRVINLFGYDMLWYGCMGVACVTTLLMVLLFKTNKQ